jgi:hypothetical protein
MGKGGRKGKVKKTKNPRTRKKARVLKKKAERVPQGSSAPVRGEDEENPLVDVVCTIMANGALEQCIVGPDGEGLNEAVVKTDVARFVNDSVTVLTQFVTLYHTHESGPEALHTAFTDLYTTYRKLYHDKRKKHVALKKKYKRAKDLPRAKSDRAKALAVIERLGDVASDWMSLLYKYIGVFFDAPVVSVDIPKYSLGHVIFTAASFLIYLSKFDVQDRKVVPLPFPTLEETLPMLEQHLIPTIKPFKDFGLADVLATYTHLDTQYAYIRWTPEVEALLSVLRRLTAELCVTVGPRERYESTVILGHFVPFEAVHVIDDEAFYGVSPDGLAFLATHVLVKDFAAGCITAFTPHTPNGFFSWLCENRASFAPPSESYVAETVLDLASDSPWMICPPKLSPREVREEIDICLAPMLDEIAAGHVFTAIPIPDEHVVSDPVDVPTYRFLLKRDQAADLTQAFVTAESEDATDSIRACVRLERTECFVDECGVEDEVELERLGHRSQTYARFLERYIYAVLGNGTTNYSSWIRTFRSSILWILSSTPIVLQWHLRTRSSSPSWRQARGFQQAPYSITAEQTRYVAPHFEKLLFLHANHPFESVLCDGKEGEALQLYMVAMWLQSACALQSNNADDPFAFLDFVVLQNELCSRLFADLIQPVPSTPFIVQMWGEWNVVFAMQRVPFRHVKHAVFFWLYLIWRCTGGVVEGKYDITSVLEPIFEPLFEDHTESVATNDMFAKDLLHRFVGLPTDVL